jgi:hypothetical protein
VLGRNPRKTRLVAPFYDGYTHSSPGDSHPEDCSDELWLVDSLLVVISFEPVLRHQGLEEEEVHQPS